MAFAVMDEQYRVQAAREYCPRHIQAFIGMVLVLVVAHLMRKRRGCSSIGRPGRWRQMLWMCFTKPVKLDERKWAQDWIGVGSIEFVCAASYVQELHLLY